MLPAKPESADFSKVARIFGVSASDMELEWKILRRLPNDLSNPDSMLNLPVPAEKAAIFPIFSTVVRKLLILPCRHGDGGTVIFDNESNSIEPALPPTS